MGPAQQAVGLQGIPVNSQSAKAPVASAHGRFQPLHLGHMEYLLAAKGRCEFLHVGVTQYITSSLRVTVEDPHRARPENNPLTYFERATVIRQALLEAGVDSSEFIIAPFPIEDPALLIDFLPVRVPIFTTVYDDWNRHKIDVLRSHGYTVEVLWERNEKKYAGVEIRKAIVAGDDKWHDMVPPATIQAAEDFQLAARLRSLSARAGELG
jgi:cytidyltransferase-like protein